jgi:hypothetical protein
MTKDHASKLALALSLGYIIIIKGTPFIAGEVTSIDLTATDPGDDSTEEWFYTDDTFDDRPLSEVDIHDVFCMERVDFISNDLEQQPDEHEFEYELTGDEDTEDGLPNEPEEDDWDELDQIADWDEDDDLIQGSDTAHLHDDDDEDSDDAQPDNDDHTLPRHGW